jgi:membrane-associated phospholipid phosphatase
LRLTARIFGIGAIFTLCAKDIIKEFKLDANKRPWNEHFKKKVTYGGFPSGHMAEATYMAIVWGLQYGLKAAIPLTAFALTSFGVLVNCNRHYVSQVVGGAALGAVYGLAANAVINKKIAETITFEMASSPQGLPNLKLAYYF